MTTLLVESLGLRLASSLKSQPPGSTKPWICAECFYNSRRAKRRPYTVAAPSPARYADYVEDEEWQDGTSVKVRRDAVIRDLLSSTTATRISELTNPASWPMVQWNYMTPFREFLEARGHPEERVHAKLKAGDPYGISHWVRQKNPDKLIAAMFRASDDPEHLKNIPKATWTEIMRTLSPEMLTQKLHRMHRHPNMSILRKAGYDPRSKAEQYFTELFHIMNLRRQHGIKADIVDYQVLLSYAARLGNQEAARSLWNAMQKDGVAANQICYNRFMEAIVWDEEDRLQIYSFARDSVPKTRSKTTNIALFKTGRSEEIIKLYNEMTAEKVPRDVSTYCVLLTTLSRDGHFDEAIKILSRVWKVDVQSLMEGNEVPDLISKEVEGSPLFPTPRLLVTIADVYGIANRLPAGFRVVDYFARQYNLRVKEHVWYQLYRWTFLQSTLKPKHRTVDEDEAQQLDAKTTRSLLDIIEAESQNTKMNLDIYDLAIRTFVRTPLATRSDFQPEQALRILRAARLEYVKVMEAQQELKMQRTDFYKAKPEWDARAQSAVYRMLHFEESGEQKKQKYLQYLQRWTRYVTQLPRSRRGKQDRSLGPWTEDITSWRVRGFPNFVETWHSFLPGRFNYSTDTGIVNLVLRTTSEELETKLNKASARRMTLAEKLVKKRRNKLIKASINRPRLGEQLRNARALDLGVKHMHIRPTVDSKNE